MSAAPVGSVIQEILSLSLDDDLSVNITSSLGSMARRPLLETF